MRTENHAHLCVYSELIWWDKEIKFYASITYRHQCYNPVWNHGVWVPKFNGWDVGKFHSGEGTSTTLCVRSYRQNLYTTVRGNPKSPWFRIDSKELTWSLIQIYKSFNRKNLHTQPNQLLTSVVASRKEIHPLLGQGTFL